MRRIAALLVCACLGACHLPNPSPRAERDEPVASSPTKREVVVRDPSLVPSETPGTVRIVEGPLREVAGVTNGREWLLQMHQAVLKEKVELAKRLAALEADGEGIHKERDSLAAQHKSVAAHAAELEARVTELEAQTLDLARRLAESELARLELQKSDLEREAKNDRTERPR